MRLTRRQLNWVIAETLLLEAAEGYFNNAELNSKIDTVLGHDYTNIINHPDTPAGIDKLMKEIVIVESGYIVNGTIMNDNEMKDGIRGVFQLSPIALKDIRNPDLLPVTKAHWYEKAKTRGTQNPWEDQSDSEIYKYIMMQAVAACMYVLRLYFWHGGDLTSLSGRADFWSRWYNSVEDEKGTSTYYTDKLEEFGIKN